MTEADKTPGRRGRKPRPPEAKARRTLAFRVRGALIDDLEKLAFEHGRSISEQVEYILERECSNAFLLDVLPNPNDLEVIREMNTTIREINEANEFRNRMVNTFVDMLDVAKRSKTREVHDKARKVAFFADEIGDLGIAAKLFTSDVFNTSTIGENLDRMRAELDSKFE